MKIQRSESDNQVVEKAFEKVELQNMRLTTLFSSEKPDYIFSKIISKL
jgi:hypothetical protein